MHVADGKMRLTDVANTQQSIRVIQSVPSPKAEPLKMRLATVGKGRIDEAVDFDAYRRNTEKKVIKKTLSLPS
jgi:hypothetical protein